MTEYQSYDNLNFINKLKKYIDIKSKIKINKSLCVVFDIDDTLILSKTKNILQKIKELYDYINKKNIIIFIITARLNSNKNIIFTKRELKYHKIDNYHSLYLMPKQYLGIYNGVANYKLSIRKKISNTHLIIMNIGDQWSDLYLNLPKYNIPNVYYIIKEKNLLNIKLISRLYH